MASPALNPTSRSAIRHFRRKYDTQRRRFGSLPRRRRADPRPRRRREDHRAAWFPVIARACFALLLLTCLANFAPIANTADSIFSNVIAGPGGARVQTIAAAALPMFGLVFGALALINQRRRVTVAKRKVATSSDDTISSEQFRTVAAANGIQPRIADRAYALLLPYFNRSRHARLQDALQDDLCLTETEVFNVVLSLLRSTDRRPRPGALYEVITVLDLLRCVESSPRNYMQAIDLSFGSTSISGSRPA